MPEIDKPNSIGDRMHPIRDKDHGIVKSSYNAIGHQNRVK